MEVAVLGSPSLIVLVVCVKVEVAVLGSPSLIVLVVSVEVKQYLNLNPHFQSESLSSRETDRQRQRERQRETDRQRAGGRGEKGQREKEVARGGGGGAGGKMIHSFDTEGGLTEATSLLEQEIFNRMTGRKKVNTYELIWHVWPWPF